MLASACCGDGPDPEAGDIVVGAVERRDASTINSVPKALGPGCANRDQSSRGTMQIPGRPSFRHPAFGARKLASPENANACACRECGAGRRGPRAAKSTTVPSKRALTDKLFSMQI